MNLQNTEFLRSASQEAQLPRDGLPQIAFAGRSNVGKSSAINCLLARKGLARTSSEPGKTIHANLYLIDRRVYFVDLPGYGYAKVPHAEKQRWSRLLESYFTTNDALRACVHVVDARHRPTEGDVQMRDVLRHYGIPFIVAANKVDKLKPSEREAALALVRDTLALTEAEPFIPFSSEKNTGRQELLSALLALIG